jgi:putative endonuclease
MIAGGLFGVMFRYDGGGMRDGGDAHPQKTRTDFQPLNKHRIADTLVPNIGLWRPPTLCASLELRRTGSWQRVRLRRTSPTRLPARMKWYVYIIRNPEGKFYKGSTQNLKQRIRYHNEGLGNWTKSKGPWKLVYSEACDTKTDAIKKEKFYIRKRS